MLLPTFPSLFTVKFLSQIRTLCSLWWHQWVPPPGPPSPWTILASLLFASTPSLVQLFFFFFFNEVLWQKYLCNNPINLNTYLPPSWGAYVSGGRQVWEQFQVQLLVPEWLLFATFRPVAEPTPHLTLMSCFWQGSWWFSCIHTSQDSMPPPLLPTILNSHTLTGSISCICNEL